MRAQSWTYHSVKKMYDTFEKGLGQSGNVEYVDTPYFVDIEGNMVTDESEAFGHRVTIKITCPKICSSLTRQDHQLARWTMGGMVARSTWHLLAKRHQGEKQVPEGIVSR